MGKDYLYGGLVLAIGCMEGQNTPVLWERVGVRVVNYLCLGHQSFCANTGLSQANQASWLPSFEPCAFEETTLLELLTCLLQCGYSEESDMDRISF